MEQIAIAIARVQRMENLYEILECEATATHEEIRKAYQTLALKHHPDKAAAKHTETSSEEFIRINRAWEILSDPKLREQYNIRWAERCLVQSYPVQDTIEFEQFEPLNRDEVCSRTNPSNDTAVQEDREEYGYDCRCGGCYVLTDSDVQMKFDLVCCDSCSLTVKVLYEEDDSS